MDGGNPNSEENILESKDAIALWQQGKDEWNKWAETHEGWMVDFSFVDFGALRGENEERISFRGFLFPGETLFHNAQLGEGKVNFVDAQFGKGKVNFVGAQFGEGNVHFGGAHFGEGDVSFSKAKFGEGNVSFSGAKFGEGDVYFIGAKFGEGNVSFSDAKFGEGKINFSYAQFGEGNISFRGAQFGEGEVSFWNAHFGEGDVNFNGVEFGKGKLHFVPKDATKCCVIDFSDTTIDSVLILSGIVTTTVINLCHAKLAYPIDLDNAEIKFSKETYNLIFKRAIDSTTSTSFRRLKKLAKEADDHERALDFFAKEKRSAYWHSITGYKLFFYYLYDWSSDYGRSIVRPIVGILVCWLLFTFAYIWISDKEIDYELSASAMVLSMGNAIPFYAGSRDARGEGKTYLYGEGSTPKTVHAIAVTQGVLSTLFTFLLGLGLRNRFRQ